MGSSSSSSSTDNVRTLLFLFTLFPVVIAGIWIAPVQFTYGVFQYTESGTIYSLGNIGYAINGEEQLSEKPQMGYTLPSSFPKPNSGLPSLLIAHFAISIILGIYLIAYLTSLGTLYFRVSSDDRAKGRGWSAVSSVARQSGYLGYFTAFAIMISLALFAADLALWVECTRNLDVGQSFQPEPFGQAMIIVGGVFAVLWFLLYVYVKWKYRGVRKSSSSDSRGDSRSRGSRSRSHR